MELSKAIQKVLEGEKFVLIPCVNKAHQESVRVSLYASRRRLLTPAQQDEIGITKEEYGGRLMVKVYQRDGFDELFTLDEQGNVVPLRAKAEDNPDFIHYVNEMKKAGLDEAEIETYANDWKKEHGFV